VDVPIAAVAGQTVVVDVPIAEAALQARVSNAVVPAAPDMIAVIMAGTPARRAVRSLFLKC